MFRITPWILPLLFLQLSLLGANKSAGQFRKSNKDNKIKIPLELFRQLQTALSALSTNPHPKNTLMNTEIARELLTTLTKENYPVITGALKTGTALERELAARVLPFFASQGVLKVLCETLTEDQDSTVRLAAAESLTHLRDAHAVTALIQGTQDQEQPVREMSVFALGEIADSRAMKALLKVIKDDESSVLRIRAAQALEKIKEPAAENDLMDLLADEDDRQVQMAIARAVRALRGTSTNLPNFSQTAKRPNRLQELADAMKQVESKLRADRHDQTVQAAQKDIDDKISTLIKEVENLQQQCQSFSNENQASKKKRARKRTRGAGKSKGQGRKPLSSHLTDQLSQRGPLKAAEVQWAQEAWAKLPPKVRGEMIQSFSSGMPPRWQRRLAAYYASIASEEAPKK